MTLAKELIGAILGRGSRVEALYMHGMRRYQNVVRCTTRERFWLRREVQLGQVEDLTVEEFLQVEELVKNGFLHSSEWTEKPL